MTTDTHRPRRSRTAAGLLSGLLWLLVAAAAGPASAQPPEAPDPAASSHVTAGMIQARLQADRHYRNGLAYGEQGRFADAVRELAAAVALDPTDADAHVSLAEAEAELGHFDAAVASLQRALALSPRHLDAHDDLARIYLERKQFDLAWRHARVIQGLNPAMANTLIGTLERVSAPSR
ncbi:MAG: tetratricopeptide repeat protein [Nitrospirae bacterium]|nr:tetratricopeptide repeat protein [Nitrospirota bacterium]